MPDLLNKPKTADAVPTGIFPFTSVPQESIAMYCPPRAVDHCNENSPESFRGLDCGDLRFHSEHATGLDKLPSDFAREDGISRGKSPCDPDIDRPLEGD
mmetsp:Transcript_67720/g.188974  ORF Transcript_67720/g.188974 Transcript_67720/m.188974 type:complete len:99 (+) Transcript_67720:238-534(+)